MPSPFPGMDPYLEDPAVWPDFHHALAGFLKAALNADLKQHKLPYFAKTNVRSEIGILNDDEGRPIIHGISIIRMRRHEPPKDVASGAVALAESTSLDEKSESIIIETPNEPARHYFVEIRDARGNHDLVTLIEIVSPSNKRRGKDRKKYVKKQQEILSSNASLIEIDLLTLGEPVVASPSTISALESAGRRSRYLVAVSREWKRTPDDQYELFPFGLFDSLPKISVPLREEDGEFLLNLQKVFDLTYDTGAYDYGEIDYAGLPDVPLTDDELRWVRERVAAAFPGISESAS